MNMKHYLIPLLAMMVMVPTGMRAQKTLTLEECRSMAIQNDKALEQARTKVEMAGYDRKTALANYFPNISATGAYMYNPNDISIVSDQTSATLQGMGTTIHGMSQQYQQKVMSDLTAYIQQLAATDPASAMKYMQLMQDPLLQTVLAKLSATDMSSSINAIGKEIDEALHPDLENIFVAGAKLSEDGKLLTNGGRVLGVTETGDSLKEAIEKAYETVKTVSFANAYYRKDIGKRALEAVK